MEFISIVDKEPVEITSQRDFEHMKHVFCLVKNDKYFRVYEPSTGTHITELCKTQKDAKQKAIDRINANCQCSANLRRFIMRSLNYQMKRLDFEQDNREFHELTGFNMPYQRIFDSIDTVNLDKHLKSEFGYIEDGKTSTKDFMLKTFGNRAVYLIEKYS